MKTTAEERAKMRHASPFVEPLDASKAFVSLLDDIDELLAERRTLRDEMAMAALHFWANMKIGGWAGELPASHALEMAKHCYIVADAMLAARRQTTEGWA